MTDQTELYLTAPRRLMPRERRALVRVARSARRPLLRTLCEHGWASVREVAEDELRRREVKRSGGTFRRLADGPSAPRRVAAPARIVHVAHYRVSGRPAGLRGYSLA